MIDSELYRSNPHYRKTKTLFYCTLQYNFSIYWNRRRQLFWGESLMCFYMSRNNGMLLCLSVRPRTPKGGGWELGFLCKINYLRKLFCPYLRNRKIFVIPALLLYPCRRFTGNKQGESSAEVMGISFFSGGLSLPEFKQGQASDKRENKNKNRIWKCFWVDL